VNPRPGVAGSSLPDSASLRRRLAAFIYEGVLLFGVLMIAGYLFAGFTQQRHALIGRGYLQLFLFLVLGIYFVWFWSRGGQTVAMKAWRIRLLTREGQALSQSRALARYLLCWMWFVPALIVNAWAASRSAAVMFGTLALGVVLYALLAFVNPGRDFLHDTICRTRLVPVTPGDPM
jgi:uncharacterized RDD family membrane protein YckC